MKIFYLIPLCICLWSCDKGTENKSAGVAINPSRQYARLTNINNDSGGNRFFWEIADHKSEAMNYEELHQYFGIPMPAENELKVQPFDYKIINHIVKEGWQLEAVSATSPSTDTVRHVSYGSVQAYHFTKIRGEQDASSNH